MVNSNDGMKTEASIDYDMDTSEPWMPVISGRLILFCVYCRICGAIANNLSGQYMRYLHIWNWAPQGKIINFGSFAQRNALDQWSNDPSLDHADQWSDESLSRVDLIDHWSENGFAQKERHRSEILIQILPKECTLNLYLVDNLISFAIIYLLDSIIHPLYNWALLLPAIKVW